MPPQSSTIDTQRFRQIMGCFATGVCIVSAHHNGELHGMTVNSLTSVSLNPPLILVCFNRNTRTEMAVHAEKAFSVNFLREDQGELSNRFARPGEDHFAGLEVQMQAGVPTLPNCLGHLVCKVINIYVEGDHSIVIGSVAAANLASGAPLLFFRGKYHGIGGGAGRAEYWYW